VAEISVFVRDVATGLVHTEHAVEFGPAGSTTLGPGSERLDRLLDR
jgi:hypothetical protein